MEANKVRPPEVPLEDSETHATSQAPIEPIEVARSMRSELRRFVVGVAVAGVATLALAEGAEAERPKIQQVTQEPSSPARIKKSKIKCAPNAQISFTLSEAKYVAKTDTTKLEIVAKRCKKTTSKILKNVTLVQMGERGQKNSWNIKKFKPQAEHSRRFNLPHPPKSGPTQEHNDGKETIIVKAVSSKGMRLGAGEWNLQYNPSGKLPSTAVAAGSTEVRTPGAQRCDPDPNFEVGIQDDNQFVYQQDMTREHAFDLSSSLLGATVLRVNMNYGRIQAFGIQPYVDAVNEARRRGLKVYMTLMATPSFEPQLDQTFGYERLDPDAARKFGHDMAQLFAGQVAWFSIGNEPNHPYFSASTSIDVYEKMYVAAREGILSADPTAKIIAGDLAPGKLDDWVLRLNKFDSDGTAVHPYGWMIDKLRELVLSSRKPIYLSEYGNFYPDPEQATKNQTAIQKARCAGARLLLFFQLKRKPEAPWNTGISD